MESKGKKSNARHPELILSVITKYVREKYSAIASLRILVYIEFGRKCTVKEVNILSAHFSFQTNMDGDEGELVRFEKFKFYFRYGIQVLR